MVRGRTLIPAFSVALFSIALVPSVSQAIQPPAKPRVDAHGDPLPEGAIARLGSNRWRTLDSPLVYSPDGKIVLAAGRQTRLFDASTGKLLRVFDLQSSRAYFSADSKTAMLASPVDNKLLFVNVDTGKVTREVSINGYQCAWSADGKRVAYPNRNAGVHAWSYAVWDIEAGKEIQQWDSSWAAKAFAISPDGKRLALSDHREISVLDVGTGIELVSWKSLHVPGRDVGANKILAFSPDGKIIASAEEHRVMLWDATTGKFAKQGKLGPDLPITLSDPLTLAFSDDGHYLAASCSDGTLYVWDLQAGALACKLPQTGNGLPLFGLTFAPDGKTLITQSLVCLSARVWEIPSGQELSPADVHVNKVDALAFSSDGKFIATSGMGDPPRLWDVGTGKLLRRFENTTPGNPSGGALAFGPTNKWLGKQNGPNLTIWNLVDGKLIQQGVAWKNVNGHAVTNINTALDKNSLVTLFHGDWKYGEPNDDVALEPNRYVRWIMIGAWDMSTGKVTNNFKVEAQQVGGVHLSADRKTVLAFGHMPTDERQRYAFGWDPRAKMELFRIALPEIRELDRIWLSPDAKTIVVYPSYAVATHRKHRFYCFEAASGKLRHVVEFEVDDQLSCRSEFAHERLAAVAVLDSIVVIDPLTGNKLRQFKSDQAAISSLAFSSDGKFLATAGDDTTTLIWDVGVAPAKDKNINLGTIELAAHWAELLSGDAVAAYAAIRRLSLAPKETVAFFKEQVRPAPIVVTAAKLKELADHLDSQRYADREKANLELVRLGELARQVLEDVVKAPPSLEAKQRAELILKKLEENRAKGPWGLTGESLRQARVVEILVKIGTPDARSLLGGYAEGSPQVVLTREAQAALKRMPK